MNRKKYSGRWFLFWGAAALGGWSGYELYVRVETLIPPLRMFFRMAFGEGIPIERAMSYFDYGIFAAPAYLMSLFLLALFALALRNRAWVAFVLIPMGAALALWGAGAPGFPALGLIQWLKLVPVGMMLAGCALNAISALRGRAREAWAEAPARPRFHSVVHRKA